MADSRTQYDASHDSPSLGGNNKSKSMRKMFSKKFSLKSSEKADRTDTASRRGERGSVQGRDPPASDAVEDMDISSFNDKGNDFFASGDYDAALRMYSEALKLLKSTHIVIETENGEEYMPTAMRRFRTARCLVNVGAVHIRRENFDDAISALEVSMRQSSMVEPSSKHYYRACEVMADALENIGLVLFKQKNYDKSSLMYADALDTRKKCLNLMDAKHNRRFHTKSKEEVIKYREERNASLLELSVTLFYISLLKERQGAIEEAVENCEESLRIRREVIPNAKQDPNSLNLFSTIGRLYCHDHVKRHQEALGYLHEVHRMKCETKGRDHLDVVPSLNSIAFIYNELGDYKKCIVISDRAIDVATNGRGLNKETCVAYANRGDAHRKLEDYESAIASYETALETQAKCLEPTDIMIAEVHEKLAETCTLSNDMNKAITSMEKSIDVKHAALGPDSEELARAHSKLGDYFYKAGHHGHGIKSHTRALRIFKHLDNKGMAATEHNRIASILKASGETNKAMEHYMASLWHSREARLPSTDPIVADTIKNVASFQKEG